MKDRRYNERGRLLHKPRYTTREFLRELDESERTRNMREAREGWDERCKAKVLYPIKRKEVTP